MAKRIHTTITKHVSPSTKVEYYVLQSPEGYYVNALTPEGSKPVVSMKPQSNRKAAILHAKVMAYGPDSPVVARYAAKLPNPDGTPRKRTPKKRTAKRSKTTTARAPKPARRSRKVTKVTRPRDPKTGRFVKVAR
jgi:hypothetical protein